MTTVVVPVWISSRLPPSKNAAGAPGTRVRCGTGLSDPYIARLRLHAGSLEISTGKLHASFPPSHVP